MQCKSNFISIYLKNNIFDISVCCLYVITTYLQD